jgi:polysaccharide biosynthesis/export protein
VNSYRFVVTGSVERPGAYTANHYVTVSEAITLAGGPNRYASPEQAMIVRPGKEGAPRRIPVDYPSILAGKRPEQDLPLQPGDTVYVP